MSREIKFRAWDTEANNWLEGTDFVIHCSERLLNIPDNLVLMQYTGLKDKQGREIYEGDLVLITWMDSVNECFEVEWNNDLASWDLRERRRGVRYRKAHGGSILWEYLEVVDNIYENPEMLTRDGEA